MASQAKGVGGSVTGADTPAATAAASSMSFATRAASSMSLDDV